MSKRKFYQALSPALLWLWKKLKMKKTLAVFGKMKESGERGRVKVKEARQVKRKRIIQICFDVLKNPRLAQRKAAMKTYTRPVASQRQSQILFVQNQAHI